MAGLFDDLDPENTEKASPTGATSGLFGDLDPTVGAPTKEAQREADSQSWSDKMRNPIGAAAEWMFPSIGERRKALQQEGRLDANGMPSQQEMANSPVASALPNLPSPDYLAADVAGGMYNTGRGILELGANLDDLANRAVGNETNFTGTFNDAIPTYQSDTTLGNIVSKGAEYVMPGAIGAKAGLAMAKNAPKAIRGAAAFTGMSAAPALTQHATDEGLVAGRDSLVGMDPAASIGLGKTGNEARDAIGQRVNMMVDNAVTDLAGGAIAGAGMAAKKIIGTVVWDRMKLLLSAPTRDTKVVTEAMNRLLQLPPDTPPAQIKEAYKTFLTEFKNNKSFKDELMKSIDPDTFASLPKEIQDELSFNKDTMSVVESVFKNRGQKGEDVAGSISQARAMREGVERQSGGAPLTEAAASRPVSATGNIIDKGYEEAGGSAAVQQTGRAIQEAAEREANQLRPELDFLKGEKASAEQSLKARVQNDPIFGKSLQDLGDSVNINIKGAQEATENEMRDKITQAIVKKSDELDKVMKKAANSGATVDQKDIINAFKTTGPDGKPTAVPLNTISDNLRDAFGNKATFQNLYPRVPEITREISRLKRAGDTPSLDAANALIRVKDLLQNPKGTPEQTDAVKKSLDYYQKEWAPYFDQGPLGDFYDTFRAEKRAIGEYPKTPIEEGMGTDFLKETRGQIRSGIKDTDTVGQTKRLLGETGDQGLIGQHYGAEALADVQARINSGDFKPEDIVDVVTKMTNSNPVVKGSPELTSQLEDLVTAVRNGKDDINTLTDQIGAVRKNLRNEQNRVYKDKFREFYIKGDSDSKMVRAPEADASFKKLFTGNSGQNLNRIKEIKKAVDAAGDPDIQKGFEASWFDTLKQKLFTPSQSATGAENVNTAFDRDSYDQLLKYGEEVFGDKKKAEFYTQLTKQAQESFGARSSKKEDVAGISSISDDAMKGVQWIITHIWGKLDPTGTKIATNTRGLIDMANTQNMYARVDEIFSNPDVFYDIAMKYANSKTPISAADRWRLWTLGAGSFAKTSPDTVKDGLNKIGLAAKPSSKPSVEEQTEEAIPQEQPEEETKPSEEEE